MYRRMKSGWSHQDVIDYVKDDVLMSHGQFWSKNRDRPRKDGKRRLKSVSYTSCGRSNAFLATTGEVGPNELMPCEMYMSKM